MPAPDALTREALSATDEAVSAVAALTLIKEAVSEEHAASVRIQRALARAEPFLRKNARVATEALWGLGAGEGRGAVFRLGGALGADGEKRRQACDAVSYALRLGREELSRAGLDAGRTAQLLSDTALDLGMALAGSKPSLPVSPAAQTAVLLGQLDAIDAADRVFRAQVSAQPEAARALPDPWTGPLREALSSGARDRLSWIRSTGAHGAQYRRAARAAGLRVRPPWLPRVPASSDVSPQDVAVSALTVPAFRGASAGRAAPDPALVRLGATLFSDKRLSARRDRACATCHDPKRGFADGVARPASLLPGGAPLRNTPTLLYQPLHAAQLWDGRVLTPEAQALGVIHAPAEMGMTEGALLAALGRAEDLNSAWREAFPRASAWSLDQVGAALAAWEEASLVPAASPLDRFARGDDSALSRADREAFDLLATKARCTRCHVPPSFGGSWPPDFATPVFSVLGVPSDPKGAALDADPGRGGVTGRDADRGAFKTPTLRNLALTGPYFHNGTFPTIEAVLTFYDRGGGKGLGLDVPNQDPDIAPLRLTADERRLLAGFLRTALRDPNEAVLKP